jgi:DNA-binding beta-propeller fold protein YncE
MSRFGYTIFLVLLNLCQWLSPNAFANFAPFAALSANSTEVYTGQAVQFSSEGSVDPDEQPEPISFRWTFGDGESSTQRNPAHSFAGPGAFTVSLEVSDGADQSIASMTVVVLDHPTAVQPVKSSPICFNGDKTELWVINQDSSTITVFSINAGALTKSFELSVGKSPRCIAFGSGRMFVTCQDVGELWIFNASSHSLERKVEVGHLPFGVCVAPVTGEIVVSNQGDSSIHIFNRFRELETIVRVPSTPRAVAINADGTRAFVTHFLTTGTVGLISEVDLVNNKAIKTVELVEDIGPDTPSSSKGFPNLLSSICVEPAGRALWVGGYKSNSGRGALRTWENLTPVNTVRAYLGRIDISSAEEEPARRIDPNNADSISSVAFSLNGRFAFVTHQGAESMSIYDIITSEQTRPGDGNSVPFLSRIDVGSAPQGVLVSDDGRFVYVANYLGRSVMVVNVVDPANPKIVQTIRSTEEPLLPSIANGKRMFYSSKAPVHSKDNYMACASCHADGGGPDGRTWDFTGKGEGLRNTTDLRGKGGMAQGPVHWSGNFDEIQDFENDIVNAFGGTGLAADGRPPNPSLGVQNSGRSQDLDDLAAYVSSLDKAPSSPFRLRDGTLASGAIRGKEIFNRPDLGCIQCHVPPTFTDSTLTPDVADFLFHDVGTLQSSSGQRLGAALTGLDTPSLLGLWASEPYLHDGSAQTLKLLLTSRNVEDKHGRTSNLTANEIDDLVLYLLSLDDPSAVDLKIDADNDGLSDSWERLYALDPTNPADGNDDPDQDGVSNFDEYQTGTNPLDPSSMLRLFARSVGTGNEIWFHTTRGLRFILESKDALPGPVWETLETIDGDGVTKFSLQPKLSNQQFYRLRVIPN